MTFFVTAQPAFHHCKFRFITAHFVHHCTLKQALAQSYTKLRNIFIYSVEKNNCSAAEHKTTPMPPSPTEPTPSPTEPPSSGWGAWGPWSDCSKPCDYGQQMRRRTCGQLPCMGNATCNQLCALDRKSTRLNSSHQIISYPIFFF